jgi:hypothetical protein
MVTVVKDDGGHMAMHVQDPLLDEIGVELSEGGGM